MFLAKKLNKGAGTPAVLDAQFNYVTMLLHGDGTNGAQNNTFLDSSSNNFTITRNGNTTQGSFSPYGSNWSNYFGGSSSYLTVPYSASLAFGTGDYTVEFWIFWTGGANENNPIMNNASGGFNIKLANGSGQWSLENSYAGTVATLGTAPTQNVWHHLAISRASGTVKAFIDGTQVFSGSDSTNWTNSNTWYIGANGYSPSTYYITGNISNLRIVKGTALYTSSFTPSTIPLTAVTNTQLLTCQSNRFIDNSTNVYALSVTGTPSVQRFNPFGTSTAYSTSVIGGSGYFDGSGDYLSIAASANQDLGATFTYEFFWYPTTLSSRQALFCAANDYWFGIDYQTGGVGFGLWASSNGTSWDLINADASGNGITNTSPILNSWNHIAIARSSGVWSIWLNGTRILNLTGITSSIVSYSTVAKRIGTWAASYGFPLSGYLSDARLVPSTAVYNPTSSTITVPTAPLTAITNTQLLLNMTNGAIFDNAMMNNLETVGNAQISTSVKKYGTGSLAFDGTGDYLYIPNFVTNQLRTADYTCEFWVYGTSWSTTPVILEYGRGPGPNGFGLEFYISTTGGKLDVYGGSTGATLLASYSSLSTGSWIHVALTRASGTTRLFINGTQSGSSVTDNTDYTSAYVTLGAWYDGTLTFNGYIDDFRITKGYARYTTTFTPPTAALPDIGPV